jgi:cytochrome c-type biogenesis protein CcmF
MPGQISIYVATVFAFLSIIFYSLSKIGYSKRNDLSDGSGGTIADYKDKWLIMGRFSYYGLMLSILFASLYLLSNILQNNFQFTYIYEYSSTELYDNFLVATFYAGQEGSFMLWTLMLTIVGFLLIPYAYKRKMENSSMIVFSSIILFLGIILIFKSPFEYVWNTYADQNIPVGFTPENGRGLNPVLQNYWITIHPPILFLGYSLLAVPYALAFGGFLRKDYRSWIKASIPWNLAAAGVLGTGLMLGGFWAYETLGWGGFWAWDPVENSSLIPWLVCVGLLHTSLISLKTGGLVRTNFFMATMSFIFVLYATFLTRSGVLGDTSVHSFVSPGPVVYQLLLIMLIAFVALAIMLIAFRSKDTTKTKLKYSLYSKEAGLIFGTVILLVLAFLVVMGTSWPILAEILDEPKQAVDPSVYNSLGLPLGILILVVSGISVFLQWKHTQSPLTKKITVSTSIAVVAAVVALALGMYDPWYLFIVLGTAFSFAMNGAFIIERSKKSFALSGAGIAHIGVALLILGAMFSGGYMETEQISLRHNKQEEVFGKKISYAKREQIELYWKDRDKYKYFLSVDQDTVHPIFYWSDFNERQSPFMEPGIFRTVSQDLYFSPKALIPTYQNDKVTLRKTESAPFTIDSNYTIQLIKFDMTEVMKNPQSETVTMGAVVRISNVEKKYILEDTLYTEIDLKRNLNAPYWYELADDDLEIGFMQLIPDEEDIAMTQAVFAFKRPSEGNNEILVFDVSRKPFINLVWAGTIVMVVGIFLSMSKYIPRRIK